MHLPALTAFVLWSASMMLSCRIQAEQDVFSVTGSWKPVRHIDTQYQPEKISPPAVTDLTLYDCLNSAFQIQAETLAEYPAVYDRINACLFLTAEYVQEMVSVQTYKIIQCQPGRRNFFLFL